MPQLLPTFLVAGAARSGTTGLVEGLRTHPDVFVTHPKEPSYFALHDTVVDFQAPGDEATINRIVVTDRAGYLALFDASEGQACLGDGSVSTLYYAERSIPEILDVNPEMRIVIMLREPVDRAYSAFQYLSARGFEPLDSFEAALDDEERRIKENWHHLWHYAAMSNYATSVSSFLSEFGPEQVGIWFYDELQADYEGTVAQVMRFIGAPEVRGEASGVPRVNVSGTPRSAILHRLIWAATRNESIRRSVKAMTSYRLREFVRRAALRPDGVTAAQRARLAPQFEGDLRALAAVLRNHPRPLPDWLGRMS